MILTSGLSILISAVLLLALGRHDPKRLRNQPQAAAAGERIPSMSEKSRRLIAWLVPAPGFVLAMFGQWWAFLVWLGASCTCGWIAAQLLASRTPHTSARR